MIKKFVLLVLLGLAFFAGTAFAMPDFSGDFVMKSKAMKGRNTIAKIYYTANKWRTDINFSGVSMSMIYRADKKVSWSIMPQSRTFVENALDPQSSMSFSDAEKAGITRKKIGSEAVNGVNCDKYEISYKVGATTHKAFQWISNDNKIAIKNEAADGSWENEINNIKVGPQPASLFEIPAGYKKMSVPNYGNIGKNFSKR
jgi:hypothetical protein